MQNSFLLLLQQERIIETKKKTQILEQDFSSRPCNTDRMVCNYMDLSTFDTAIYMFMYKYI